MSLFYTKLTGKQEKLTYSAHKSYFIAITCRSSKFHLFIRSEVAKPSNNQNDRVYVHISDFVPQILWRLHKIVLN